MTMASFCYRLVDSLDIDRIFKSTKSETFSTSIRLCHFKLRHFLLAALTLRCINFTFYFADDAAVVGKSSFSSKPQFSSSQTYGEKSETEGVRGQVNTGL